MLHKSLSNMEEQTFVYAVLENIRVALAHSKNREVIIGIGQLTGLSAEQIIASIRMLAPEIIEQKPVFRFFPIPGKIWCTGCGYRGDPGEVVSDKDDLELVIHCPKCNSTKTIKTEGAELEVIFSEKYELK